ncbi:helix-turn-helix domain-containing protein [Streptomyces sp. NPDC001744]|uniref:AraC-like ligand-binding domain-containing protein n=1 Tax=Streptomyces sp. NPDC001744 TaxID=3364606 RepID=UPI00368D9E8F
MQTIFDSFELPVHERIDAWVETTALALVPTRFRFTDPERFGGRLRGVSLGAADLTAMSYSGLVSQRSPALIRKSDPEQYQLALITSGRQAIEQDRRSALLGPGDLVLYDSSLPFDARAETDGGAADSVLLQFPKSMVPLQARHIGGLLATPLSGREGVGSLYARFVTGLVEEQDRCTPGDLARLGTTLLDLAVTLLAHHVDRERAVPGESRQEVLFLRITSFIDGHLGSPDLTPPAVAGVHGISVRYLHRVFQQRGETVAAYIRRRRLEQCRRDLADPALRDVTVQAVAARWGFPRPADFTRSFRRAFGTTPRQYREDALGGRSPAGG